MIPCLRVALLVVLFGLGAAAAAEPPLVRHDASVTIEPESGRLDLRDRITVSGRDSLTLAVAAWQQVVSASLNGAPLDLRPGRGPWTITLPERDAQSIELRLTGIPPRQAEAPDGEPPSFAVYGSLLPATGAERLNYRLTISTPPPLRAVAIGSLVEETFEDGVQRVVYEADYPAEPPSLFVGPYEVRERVIDGLRLRTWFHPGLEALSDIYLEQSAAYIERFAAAIGPYPFDGFDVVSAPIGVGLGFPGLTYVGRQVLPLPFMRGRSLAHEVLHNWWGNGVAAELSTGNWVEGLTTYMADYALSADRGEEAAREMRLGWLRDFAALPPERDRPVTAFVTKQHQAGQVVGYNKVAFIFHMLRDEIGAAAFDEGLRSLWQDRLHAEAGWRDIREHMERASQRDLTWFFDQWLDRKGAPEVALGDIEMGPESLTVTLRQEARPFRLRVPIEIETASEVLTEIMTLEGSETDLTIALPEPAVALRVDPDHQVFRRLLQGESPPILRDVTLSKQARVVIAAGDDDTAEAAQALAARLLDRPEETSLGEVGAKPLLLVGNTSEIAALLAEAGWQTVPESLVARGTARAWTLQRENGAPVFVVAANDAPSLVALMRPLPHYGGKSWLVFEGRRAIETGVWRVEDSPLSVRFD